MAGRTAAMATVARWPGPDRDFADCRPVASSTHRSRTARCPGDCWPGLFWVFGMFRLEMPADFLCLVHSDKTSRTIQTLRMVPRPSRSVQMRCHRLCTRVVWRSRAESNRSGRLARDWMGYELPSEKTGRSFTRPNLRQSRQIRTGWLLEGLTRMMLMRGKVTDANRRALAEELRGSGRARFWVSRSARPRSNGCLQRAPRAPSVGVPSDGRQRRPGTLCSTEPLD